MVLYTTDRDNVYELYKKAAANKAVGLALSGGSIRGFAHIGLYKAMEEYDVKVNYVAGTSAGSLVAVFIAAGYSPARLIKLGTNLEWQHLVRLSRKRYGLVSGDGIARFVAEELKNPKLDELKIPCLICTTNFESGRLQIFNKGDASKPVQASCSIPGLFDPVIINDVPYVDGGTILNLPTSTLYQAGAEFVVSCDLMSQPQKFDLSKTDLISVVSRAFLIMVENMSRAAIEDSDILITPDMKNLNSFDMNDKIRFIIQGYRAGVKAFRELGFKETKRKVKNIREIIAEAKIKTSKKEQVQINPFKTFSLGSKRKLMNEKSSKSRK